jgi:glycosyltransferase involved in cell wall biosynthesis
MHVLIIPSWYPSQPGDPFGSFFREQALAIQRAGCKVGVLAPRLVSLLSPLSSFKASRSVQIEVDEGIPTYRQASMNWTPRLWHANARRIESLGWQIYQEYCKKHGCPDIIHVHSTIMSGVVAKTILERDGVPFVVSEHSSAYARGQVPQAGKEIVRYVAEKASGKFAVSTPFCRLLEKTLNFPNNSYICLPNMVDQAFLEEPMSFREGQQKRFLHVSMLDKNKNVQLILHAFCDAFLGNMNISLTIGGDGPERSELISLAKELEIEPQINFLGRLDRDEVRKEMAQADAFLLSSNYETFGIVVVEATAMGLPVVATRCGGPEDVIREQTGLLVPKGDVSAYAAAMKEVIIGGGRWSAESLRSICKAEYGPDAITARWLDLYDDIVSRTACHKTTT